MRSRVSRRRWRAHACTVVSLLFALLGGQSCDRSREGEAPKAGTSAAPAAAEGEVVARYQGRKLTSGELLKELERLPAPSRVYLSQPERRRQFVENLVMNDLLFREGQRAGLDRDAEIERQVDELRKRLVVQRVMRQYQNPPTVSDDEVRAYYDANPTLYSTTQIRASHILVKDEETAKQIRAELEQHPERFADLAKEKSTDAGTAQKGGDLGLFGAGRMVAEFDHAAFALQPGQISEPVKTRYGWHIISVVERKEGERKPFEQVREQIRTTLRNQRLQQQVDGHFAELKKNAALEIDEAALGRVNITATPTTPSTMTPGAAPAPPSPTGH
jgi:peptidyl-prolyl cis-trans isomerase C